MHDRFTWNGPVRPPREIRTWWMHPEQLANRVKFGDIIQPQTQFGPYTFRNGDVVMPDADLPKTGYFAHPAKFYRDLIASMCEPE